MLDAELSAGAPRDAIASTLIDVTACAIEAWVSMRRTVMSDLCAREAWRHLARASSVAEWSDDPSHEPGAPRVVSRSTAAGIRRWARHACARPLSRHTAFRTGRRSRCSFPRSSAGTAVSSPTATRSWRPPRRGAPPKRSWPGSKISSRRALPERLAAAGVIESELPCSPSKHRPTGGEFNPRNSMSQAHWRSMRQHTRRKRCGALTSDQRDRVGAGWASRTGRGDRSDRGDRTRPGMSSSHQTTRKERRCRNRSTT